MEEDVEKRAAANGGFVASKFSVENERTGEQLTLGRRSPESPVYDTSPKARLLENTGDVNRNGRGQNGHAVRESSDSIPMQDRTISRSSGSLRENAKKWAKPRTDKKNESNGTKKATLRPLNRRSSLENFGRFGLLAPAVALAPAIHGSDELTKTFVDLQGENRELKLAAAHIDDALAGRGKYGKARAIFKPKFAQRCFYIMSNRWFKRFLYLVILLHCLLAIWEPPQDNINPGSMAQRWWVYACTSFCLLCYYLDITLHMVFMTWRVYWSLDENKFMRYEFILVSMFTIDFLLLIIQEAISSQSEMRLAQPFRCLRFCMMLCKAKNVGHIFDVVLSITIKLGKVFFIIILFILTFSAIGVHLFMDNYHNTSCTTNSTTNTTLCQDDESNIYTAVFDHVGISFLRLFVLLSTENYPDFMIPAYNNDRAAFVYFFIFLWVGVYFLAAILLAIIVDSYWEFSKKHVKRERSRERAELGKAWNLLDPLGTGQLAVNDERLAILFRILKPKNTDEENKELITEIDQDSDGFVDAFDWTTGLNDALSFEFEESDEQEVIRSHGRCVTYVIDLFKKVAQATAFSIFILVLIGIHSILFLIRWHMMSAGDELIVQAVRSSIVFLFLVEIVIRFIGLGKKMLDPLELADMFMVVVAIAGNVAWYVVVYVNPTDVPAHRGWCVVASSVAVFIRLGFNSSQTKKAFVMFMKIYPVMFDLLLLVFIIIYVYSILGMEIFYQENSDSIDKSYDTSLWDYNCGLGFQTFGCSFLVVFQVVTTSNWHEIMNAAILNTSYWSALYFVSCYIVVNLVVMNLFVAIAIEAFNKLGKNDDDEGQLEKEKASFADTAKNFLNAVFESTRNEAPPSSGRRGSIAHSANASRASTPRTASRQSTNKVEDGLPRPDPEVLRRPSLLPTTEHPEDSDEDKEEDLSGLSKEEKMQRRMKNRKRNKRKQVLLGKLRAIQAFMATKASELDLKVGDELDALEKKGEWYKGRKHDKVGWFPVTHVEELGSGGRQASVDSTTSTKSAEEPPKPAPRTRSSLEHIEPAPPVAPKIETPRSSLTEPPLPKLLVDSSQGNLLERASSALKNDMSKFRPRLKKKKSSTEWRRSILGDMTVMNPEEMKELNKIVKGGIRMSSRRNKVTRKTTVSSMSSDEGIQEEPEEEEEEENPLFLSTYPSINTSSAQMTAGKSVSPPTKAGSPPTKSNSPPTTPQTPVFIQPPQVIVEHEPPKLPEVIEEEEEEEEVEAETPQNVPSTSLLGVSGGPKPPPKKNKSGEMPDWAKKFVQEHSLTVEKDLKITEDIRDEGGSSDDEKSSVKLEVGIPGAVDSREEESKV